MFRAIAIGKNSEVPRDVFSQLLNIADPVTFHGCTARPRGAVAAGAGDQTNARPHTDQDAP